MIRVSHKKIARHQNNLYINRYNWPSPHQPPPPPPHSPATPTNLHTTLTDHTFSHHTTPLHHLTHQPHNSHWPYIYLYAITFKTGSSSYISSYYKKYGKWSRQMVWEWTTDRYRIERYRIAHLKFLNSKGYGRWRGMRQSGRPLTPIAMRWRFSLGTWTLLLKLGKTHLSQRLYKNVFDQAWAGTGR